MKTQLLPLFVFLCLLAPSEPQSTTPHIREVFLGKCYLKNPTTSQVNCSQLWNTFATAASLSPSLASSKDWTPFFDTSSFVSPLGSALLWSGSKDFSAYLSDGGLRFTTLEESPVGYILNGLTWCGQNLSEGTPSAFDYSNPCIYPNSQTNFGMEPVWQQSSLRFALGASGIIHILLQPAPSVNGTYVAFRNTSILSTIELPALNASTITGCKVLVLKNASWPTEVCASGSLNILSATLSTMFAFNSTCTDDPQQIVDILCENDFDQSAECLAARLSNIENSQNSWFQDTGLEWFIATVALAIALVLALIVLVVRETSRRQDYVEV